MNRSNLCLCAVFVGFFAGLAQAQDPRGESESQILPPPTPAASSPAPTPLPETAPPSPAGDCCATALPTLDRAPSPASPQLTLQGLAAQLEALSGNLSVSTSDGSWKLGIFGWLQGSMIFSTSRPVAPGVPLLLFPPSPFGFSTQTIDVTARPSALGGLFSGPDIGGFKTGGMVLVFFYSETLINDVYGILPFQLWGDIKNDDWRFAAGLQKDIFNPLDPNLLAFSVLFGSGNAGNYRGQFRIERYIRPADDVRITLTGGLSDPITTTVTNALQISEDNGWPNVEGRAALGLGPVEGEGLLARQTFEVGLSGVVGQIRTSNLTPPLRVVADVWGVGTDCRWKITDRLGVQGELYAGQTLGTYNGGALQNVNSVTHHGIHSAGGWGEAYFYYVPQKLHSHLGYGIDDPLDRDVAPDQIVRNRTYFANIIWDVSRAFRLGFEATWRKTAYLGLGDAEGATLQVLTQWNF